MKKNMFKKVICLVIALMMMMPAIPSNLVSAEETPELDEVVQGIVSPTTTSSAITVMAIGDGGTYSTEAGVMDAMGQSTNNHLVGYLAWIEENTENLYIAFNASDTAVDLKTLIGVIYYNEELEETTYYGDKLTGIYEEIHGPITIDGVTYGPNDPITNEPYEFPNWLVINLGEINFSDPFYIGLDYSENGFDALENGKIKIDILNYTVTYHANGGTGTMIDTNNPYLHYDWVEVMNNEYTYDNYYFVIWNTQADGNGLDYYEGEEFQMPEHDVDLYAVWSPVPQSAYKVKHYLEDLNADTYTLKDTDDMTGTTGAQTAAEANTYPGFTAQSFSQETIAADGSTVVEIYYTRNTYTLTYEITGDYFTDSSYATADYEYEATVTAVATPSKTGYTFVGWTGVPATMPANDVTATGYYNLRTDLSYTINYYKDSVTNTEDVNFLGTATVNNVTYLAGITLTADQLDDYQQIGYHDGVQQGTVPYVIQVEDNVINVLYSRITVEIPVNKVWIGEEPYESNGVVVNLMSGEQLIDSLTLNGLEWTDSFTVPQFDSQGNEIQYSIEEVDIEGYNSSVTKNEDGSYTITNTELADIIVEKYWNDSDQQYEEMSIMQTDETVRPDITFRLWVGDEEIDHITLTDGATIGTFYNKLKYDVNGNLINYIVTEDAVEGYDSQVNGPYDDGALYVYVTNTIKESSVYYNANGGSGTMTDELNPYKYGETVTVLANAFTRSNYRFNGWNTAADGSGTSYTAGNTFTMPASDVTLYAQWRKKSNPPVIIVDPEPPLADLEKFDHFAYVIGYPEGDVRPLNNITREEVAMIFYRLLTDESRNELLSDENSFTDLENHEWSNRAISTLFNAGIIKGYPDGTFKPSDPISRAEFATIAAKFDKLELSSTSKFTDIFGHWAEKYITSSEIKGWIKGYPDLTFKPEQDITRAEAMTLINNVLERAVPEENIHPDAMFWADNTSDKWYYEAVMEATNSHDYIYEEDGDELWTGMKANKVWP